jgi:hypothetical protein
MRCHLDDNCSICICSKCNLSCAICSIPRCPRRSIADLTAAGVSYEAHCVHNSPDRMNPHAGSSTTHRPTYSRSRLTAGYTEAGVTLRFNLPLKVIRWFPAGGAHVF